jgi:hypothetical protein
MVFSRSNRRGSVTSFRPLVKESETPKMWREFACQFFFGSGSGSSQALPLTITLFLLWFVTRSLPVTTLG